jgi:FAD:protein FMN transferase
LEINLGAIGKGYALDRAAECLQKEWGVSCAMIQGGTSSVVAMSKPDSNGPGWPIAIKHPWEPDRRLGTIFLENQALGTSAATYQYFEYKGRKLGHLLDPRTGWPAETVAQVSVIAPTAAEADALSTAFFVLGLEATKQYCQANPTIGAIVLPQDETDPVVMNITKDQWRIMQ